jgi:hypothetical protein
MSEHNACAIAMDRNGTLFIAVHNPASRLGYSWMRLPTVRSKTISHEIVRGCDLVRIERANWMVDFYITDERALANYLEEMRYMDD